MRAALNAIGSSSELESSASMVGASSTPRDTGRTGLQLVKRVLPGRGAAALVGTGVAVGQEEVVGERLL